MAKNRDGGSAVVDAPAETAAVVAPAAEVPTSNFVLTFWREHPGNRASYTIPGVSGNCVIFRTLFADGVYPKTITLDCAMALPQAKVNKSEAAAARAEEKARKAAERLEKETARAAERQRKADEALAKAKAKVEAAQAAKTAGGDAPSA